MKIFVKNPLKESLNSDKFFASDREKTISENRFYTLFIDSDKDVRLNPVEDDVGWKYLSTKDFREALRKGDILIINESNIQ